MDCHTGRQADEGGEPAPLRHMGMHAAAPAVYVEMMSFGSCILWRAPGLVVRVSMHGVHCDVGHELPTLAS